DTSTPSGNATAAHLLISEGVYAVIEVSAFAFGGARELEQAGIPVVGWGIDGPEWGQEPYNNMFTAATPLYTRLGGTYYNYDYYGKFLDGVGGTKLAGLAYGVSPSSQVSVKATFQSGSTHGVSQCYSNYSVPFGGVDFTAAVLSIKSAGCNAVVGSF